MKLFEEGVGLSRECQKNWKRRKAAWNILLRKPTASLPLNRLIPNVRVNREAAGCLLCASFLPQMKLPAFFEETVFPWTLP